MEIGKCLLICVVRAVCFFSIPTGIGDQIVVRKTGTQSRYSCIKLFEAIVKQTGSRLQTTKIHKLFEHSYLTKNVHCPLYFVYVMLLCFTSLPLSKHFVKHFVNVNIILVFAQTTSLFSMYQNGRHSRISTRFW